MMTIDDAEPLPLPQSETKPQAQPYAEPNAKPKVTDLPTAPTDLAPTGKVKPENQTRPDAPPIDITKLPQPNTEGLPRNVPPPQTPQPNSPKNLDRIIPPVTLGGAIFVRPEFADNVRVLREEMIHTYQQAAGIATNELVQGEIDARLRMIVNRHVWGIENNEVREMIEEVRKIRETGKY